MSIENEIILALTNIKKIFGGGDSENLSKERREEALKELKKASNSYDFLTKQSGQAYRKDLAIQINDFKDKLAEYNS